MKTILSILLLLFVYWGNIQATPANDSLRVYFRHGYSVLNLAIYNNKASLDTLVARINAFRPQPGDTTSIHIRIEGNASPSGASNANLRLSRRRAERVADYLRPLLNQPRLHYTLVAGGVDWDGLTALVEQTTDLPAWSELLHILRHTPLWIRNAAGQIDDGRKKQLMDLYGGSPYRVMAERLFPRLRNAHITVYLPKAEEIEKREEMEKIGKAEQMEKIGKAEQIEEIEKAEQIEETGKVEEIEKVESIESFDSSARQSAPVAELPYRLALKTNLLYDAVLMPSLEVEYRINPRWTVNLEGDMAWWHNSGKEKYYQVATISPEGRYWFKSRRPWHGHYIGAFGGFTWYDLADGTEGWRGEAVTAGLTYGYMFPITRRLSLEAGLGLGYMYTRYEEYLPMDGHHVYLQTKRMSYFGPLKLKFNLVWRLWKDDRTPQTSNRKGGTR